MIATYFARRPFFWLGLFAVLGAAVQFRWEWSPWVWLWVELAAVLVMFSGGAGVGAGLAVAGLAGLLVGAPPGHPALDTGRGVTVAGTVGRVFPGCQGMETVLLQRVVVIDQDQSSEFGAAVLCRIPAGARVGDQLEAVGRLEGLRAPGNPGEFNVKLRGRRHRAAARLLLSRNGAVRRTGRSSDQLRDLRENLREKLRQRLLMELQPPATQMVPAPLFGLKPAPDPQETEDLPRLFREAGLLHLLVVSGSQVMLLVGVCLFLTIRAGRWSILAWCFTALALIGYGLVVEDGPSVHRALWAGAILAGAHLARRRCDALNALGLAALAQVLSDPGAILDVGAQLSFGAVFALVVLGGPLLAALQEETAGSTSLGVAVSRWAGVALATSLSAHIGVNGILAGQYQQVSWSAILANLVVGPLAGLLLVASAVQAVLVLLGIGVLTPVLQWLSEGTVGWVRAFGSIPFGQEAVFPVPAWVTLLVLAGAAGTGLLPPRLLPRLLWTGMLAAVLLLAERLPAHSPTLPEVTMFAVGQGDGFLYRGPGDATLLVDTGPPPSGCAEPPWGRRFRSLRIPRLDVLLITHDDADHTGGARTVMRELHPRLLLHQVERAEGPEWELLMREAGALGITVQRVVRGQEISLGRSRLQVLWPPRYDPTALSKSNDQSVVFRLVTEAGSMLFTGDAEAPVEEWLLDSGADLAADVLKVGHHGSRTSTSEAWLQRVRPRLALISCGRNNRHRHPHREVTDRLRHHGIPFVRTDLEGAQRIRLTPAGPKAGPLD